MPYAFEFCHFLSFWRTRELNWKYNDYQQGWIDVRRERLGSQSLSSRPLISCHRSWFNMMEVMSRTPGFWHVGFIYCFTFDTQQLRDIADLSPSRSLIPDSHCQGPCLSVCSAGQAWPAEGSLDWGGSRQAPDTGADLPEAPHEGPEGLVVETTSRATTSWEPWWNIQSASWSYPLPARQFGKRSFVLLFCNRSYAATSDTTEDNGSNKRTHKKQDQKMNIRAFM